MDNVYEKLMTCLASVRQKTDFVPEVALILGSGLGNYAEHIKTECMIEYTEIEGFPVSTVAGHKGRYVFGYIGDVPVVAMQGRVHYYEGVSYDRCCTANTAYGTYGSEKAHTYKCSRRCKPKL